MQSQEFKALAKQLKDNLSRLMEKRSNWESHWQEVSDFMLPRKAEITMIIGCGIMDEKGIYAPRFRVALDEVYKRV